MSVRVLFFGATADAAGAREIEEPIEDKTSLQSLLDRVLEKHPRLLDHKLLIAVNEEYSDPDRELTAGDEVAVFTAVSGG